MPKQVNDKTVNVTFTLTADIVSWINRHTTANDINQSQLARKIFREAMAAEANAKLTKAGKKGK